ncbi:MAG TPA: DUF3536 domain-containing protein [Candidatus Limnocylindrales bacterium]|nr:DUF3536 domain-containing protein [Candidatus Limnocylindrales bacterium]
MTRGRLVVHAHFYKPFRVDPFSGRIPDDLTAAPFRNWNERITAECYRPIAELRIPERISWNLGATLTAYLAREAPAVLAEFAAQDRAGQSGMAQAFHHSILPLASVADRRTEILWGLRDFAYRFGREATAMWLPETAVDLATLRVAAEAGVRAVILAPWQADVPHVDPRRPYRVDVGGGRHITAMFYDGDLSGAVSFEPGATADADRFARDRVGPRLAAPLHDGGPPTLVIATDGELYGHHQSFRDLFLQRLVAPEAGAGRSFDVVGFGQALAEHEDLALEEIRIRDRTSWSCHHGVLRWTAECPDVPDGRWKGPLRAALERLAGGIDSVTDALAHDLPGLDDPWAARDRYGDVVIGAEDGDAFAASCLGGRSSAAHRARLLDLMEAQRWRLGMFASCGWFWDDPIRTETHQVLRAAARAVRLVDGLAGTDLEQRLVEDLSALRSPSTGMDGAAIYRKALSEVGQPPPAGGHAEVR